jgi:hypothetical protein
MTIRRVIGALVGWKWEPTESGVIVRLQVAESRDAYAERRFDMVDIALNERQLRSLARDLTRAAEQRGIALRPPGKLRRFWRF